MFYILLTTFYILFTAFAWRRLPWAVLFIIATLPSYLIRFRIGPMPMTLLEGMVIVIFAIWTVQKLRNVKVKIKNVKFYILHFTPANEAQNEQAPLGHFRRVLLAQALLTFYIPIALFLIAATISMFIAPDFRAAAGIWKAYFLEPILFFVVLMDLLRNRATRYTLHATQIIFALSITALLLSLYAIFQRFTGFGIPPPWDKELRVTSIFPYPNALGLFLAPLVPLFIAGLITTFRHPEPREEPALSLSKGSHPHAHRLFVMSYWLLVILASIMAIVFAHSAGAMVGIAAGLFIMGILWLRQKPCGRTKSTAVALGVFAALVALLLVFSPPLRNELLLRDWSGHVRRTQWSETTEMLKDRPLLGAGLAGYKETLAPYHKAAYLEIFEYPHDIVLNFWSETGLLGVISFAWLIIVFFRASIPPLSARGGSASGGKIREGRVGYEYISIAAISSMVVILTHGLVDVPYFKNDLAILFWIVYALGVELSKFRPYSTPLDTR